MRVGSILLLLLLALAVAGCGGGRGQPGDVIEQPAPRRVVLTGGPFPALGIETVFDVETPFAAFDAFSGLGSTSELVELDDPSRSFLRLALGRSAYSNITLKRGVVSDAFRVWRNKVAGGSDTRVDLTLTLFHADGTPLRAFILRGASVLRSKPNTSDSSTAATEEVEMVVERLERG
jgi:phage tail-like protein